MLFLPAVLASLLALGEPALDVRESVVAGSPGDFMEVRHVALRGTSREIGKKLAEIAAARFGVKPGLALDPDLARAQRAFFAKNWPAQLERMMGVADFHGGRVDDGARDYGSLDYLLGGAPAPGCSVAYFPPRSTTLGAGVVSRNYDFTTGTIMGGAANASSPPCTSRPVVLETRPTDGGLATLSIVSYDLLGSSIDGINSAGLVVALLADDEIMQRFPIEPTRGAAAGLAEIQTPRFLLETCSTVEEAKDALLSTRQYYSFIPCHYLVADAHGKSFVFEWSAGRNVAHAIDGGGAPQVTTNFMRHLHPQDAALPSDAPEGSFSRYRAIADRAKSDAPLSVDAIRAAASCAFARSSASGARPPGRTLWHALYVPEKRSLEVDFYLGENPNPDADGGWRGRRSGPLAFRLE